jgi:hypothetical protein
MVQLSYRRHRFPAEIIIGTGNLFRPSRELNQIIREVIRLIRESRAGRDLTAT